MARALRLIVSLLLAATLLTTTTTAQERPFFHSDIAADAIRYEQMLRRTMKPDGKPAANWRRQGDQALKAKDLRKAMTAYAQAVVNDPKDTTAWLALARVLPSVPPATDDERYNLTTYASGAAFNAYQRSDDRNRKAESLVALADTLKMRAYWRPALDALKVSLQLVDDPAVRESYDTLRAEQGFRIIDYSVDADALTPRLCIQFSEELAKGGDFAKFISVDGKDPTAVVAQYSELCVEGLGHGQRYQVLVRSGLPSAVDETLLKSSELTIYVRDRSPQVRFTGRNYVLPNRGQQGIPVVSVNTELVELEVLRIGDRGLARAVIDGELQNQYSGYQLEDLRNKSGAPVWKGELPVRQEINTEVTTAFPVADAIPSLQPGVYVMLAKPKNKAQDYWAQQATQWFIVSDLGLTAFSGGEGLHAFVRSLASADPVAGATVRIIARNNDVLASGTSDASGYVHFSGGVTRGEGGLAPAVLIAETGAGDYAFLDLTTGAFDLTDRGVAGREAPGPLDGYLFTERGVYRPGEPVNLTALLRDRNAAAATGIPLTLIVSRPDGVEHVRSVLPDQGLGGRTTTLRLSAGAMTGTWRARIHTDPDGAPVGEVSFLVEDYVPERMELTLAPASEALTPGIPGIVRADGRYLYGPPAADLAVEGEVIVQPAAAGLAGYAGYRFGLAEEEVSPVRGELTGLPNTDVNGHAEIPVLLPSLPRTSRLLEAKIVLRLREPSGRVIERTVVLPVRPERTAVGIKPLFSGELGRGAMAEFDVLAVGPDGKPQAARALAWTLFKVERSYQWYGRNGYWSYEPIVYTNKVAEGAIDVEAGAPARIAAPVDWGSYRLEITSADSSVAASSITFNAGWYGGGSADSPEVLDIGFDKPSYRPGETARLTINSETAGKAIVAVMRDDLMSMREVSVAPGATSVELTVDSNWSPGAYVTAVLYRAMDEAAKRMPSRSIGVRWLAVDPAARTLAVAIGTPEKVASGGRLEIPVKLEGLAAGESAQVVVAAVDVGILNLTRFETPAPDKWYFAQRRLGLEIRDLYGRLIDGMRAERGTIRSGGDGGGLQILGSPPVQQPVALFSGMIPVGADGSATVGFDLPEFNGALRVMAVVWSKDKVGHGEKDVIVRDPVAMLVSGPRFMTLGDEARLVFDLHNVEGEAGSYRLTIDGEDETGTKVATIASDIALGVGERRLESLLFKAERIGATGFTVHLTGPGGIDVARTFALEIKAPGGDVKRSTSQTLAAKGGKITVTADVLKDLVAETAKVTIAVGAAAGLDVPGLLTALDRYPYGCAEQITSRALPLLYYDTVAAAAGITGDAGAKERIQQSIARLFEMQDSSGSFGLWGPGSGEIWLSAYVADFLTRAKEQGYSVPSLPFSLALDRLQNAVATTAEFESGGEDIAYALYVLARNGRAPIGDLRYYADTRIENFATAMAKAQIGAALALYGDKERAERVFSLAIEQAESSEGDEARYDYGSTLRDGAATLTLVSETRTRMDASARLSELVARSRVSRDGTSTQENAWMLLAARAALESDTTVPLDVNGAPHEGSFMRSYSASDLAAGPIAIRNDSDTNVQAIVTVVGEGLQPEPATASGFRIVRRTYKPDGTEVDLTDPKQAKLAQNDRLVVVLQVTSTDGLGGRALLVDRLPAGLEVENPRLVEGGSIAALSWLGATSRPEHQEFRDDRFIAAFDLDARNEEQSEEIAPGATVAYVVRAVTPGTFHYPGASIEDMYRPQRFARTAAGRIEIAGR